MPIRSNTSRSKELDVVKFAFRNDIPKLKKFLLENKNSGVYQSDGIYFKYGNIERLLTDFDWGYIPKYFPLDDIKEIYHLDGLSKNEKISLEIKFNLTKGILTSKSKADLLLLTENGVEIITFKDSTVAAKLGQVSSSINYANFTIRGGLFGNIPIVNVQVLSHYQTGLSKDQFLKLQQRDKDLAYFKNNFPEDWKVFVLDSLKDSVDQLKNLGQALISNKEVFLEFISKTLFGQSEIPSCFKIIFGDVMISSELIGKFFKSEGYKIICEEYNTSNKFSLIVSLEINSIKYGITKIEPAFDGARVNVSQTKGIIYYFQQFPSKELHIWQLLKDIPKYIV